VSLVKYQAYKATALPVKGLDIETNDIQDSQEIVYLRLNALPDAMVPAALSEDDPGPSTKLVRSFSDDLASENPKDSLVRGLAAKVSHDREKEQRLIILRNEWQWLFRDARQLAQMYDPESQPP
jgi:hypothetical protein